MDLKKVQKRIYKNKVEKNFNVTDISKEFCLLYGVVSEAYNAYKNKENIGEELADIFIYLLGLAEILGVDMAVEVNSKMEINEKQVYCQREDGVFVRVENSNITEKGSKGEAL